MHKVHTRPHMILIEEQRTGQIGRGDLDKARAPQMHHRPILVVVQTYLHQLHIGMNMTGTHCDTDRPI